MVHAVGATLLAGRILHALGLMLQTGPSIGRVLGMALTWIALLSAGVGLIAYGVL
ncbi:MAPEG family protein [Brevundimonas albigilva]|nr:MAPEG family protein [Brevundimonas albigilva]UQV17761.1 MAPEG family protein [Brevundimonas albigilva]